MTHVGPPPSASWQPRPSEAPAFGWLPHLLFFLRRRWRTLAVSTGICVGLALTYVLIATPRYTAELELLIDISRTDQLRQQTTPHDSLTLNSMLESQAQVLQSAGLARKTVQRLGLDDSRRFALASSGMLETVRVMLAALQSSGTAGQPDPVNLAAQRLLKMMKVRRIGQTYVIGIGVTSASAEEAAWLANGIADTYLADELQAKEDGIHQATGWLQARIAELHDQALVADRAVQDFKAQHNIIDTDKGLMGGQQLSELSSQLVAARANSASMLARLQRIDAIIRNGVDGGGVADGLDNKVIVTLRQQFVDDDRRIADLTAKYGPDHLAIRDLRAEMAEVKRSIQGELSRIADSYKSDYEVARASEASVQTRLDQMVANSAQTNNDLVVLRSLQSSADTFRSLYQNFLQRYTQAVQDQSFPVPEARVITAAVPPDRKSEPKTTIILLAAIALGGGLGFSIAIARETLDSGIRNATQLRATTGMECLALAPRVGRREVEHTSPPMNANRGAADSAGFRSPSGNLWRHVIDAPRSEFADAIRAVQMRIIRQRLISRDIKVIGCMADSPGAGASTIAANLAQSLARTNGRTILLDWDFVKPTLSRELLGSGAVGCLDVLAGRVDLPAVVRHEQQNELDFLPAGRADLFALPRALGSSEQMHDLLARVRATHSYVVVDLPSLPEVADAHYAAHLLDAIVIVTAWGRPRPAPLIENLARVGLDATNILGVVLNKADLNCKWQGVTTTPEYAGMESVAQS